MQHPGENPAPPQAGDPEASADVPGASADGSVAAPGPVPGAVPGPRRTRVATALAELPRLDATPLSGHPDIYQQIHGELQGALAEIDNA